LHHGLVKKEMKLMDLMDLSQKDPPFILVRRLPTEAVQREDEMNRARVERSKCQMPTKIKDPKSQGSSSLFRLFVPVSLSLFPSKNRQ
jgi:hypothetical protein